MMPLIIYRHLENYSLPDHIKRFLCGIFCWLGVRLVFRAFIKVLFLVRSRYIEGKSTCRHAENRNIPM